MAQLGSSFLCMYSAAFQITYRAVWIELFSSKFFIKRRISENCSCAFDWIFWPIRFLLGFSIFLFFFFFLISATLSSLWPFLNLSPSIHLSLFSLFFHFHIFFRYFIQRSTRPLICVDWSVFARSLSRNLAWIFSPKYLHLKHQHMHRKYYHAESKHQQS